MIKKEHRIIDGIEMKHCGHCNTWCLLDEFNRSSGTWDGVTNGCKECRRTNGRKYYHEISEGIRIVTRESPLRLDHEFIDGLECKRCRGCQQYKPLDEFHKTKTKWDGLQGKCRKCTGEHDRQYYAENSERYCEWARQWATNNPEKVRASANRRRAHKRDNGVEPYSPSDIYERECGICHLCGKHVGEDEYWIEHLVPVTPHGPDAPWNVRIAHPSCNSSKHNTMPSLDEICEWCNELLSRDDYYGFNKFLDLIEGVLT